MNRFITKLTVTIAVAAISSLGAASNAFAGEGGVAGAAAFTIDTKGSRKNKLPI